MGWKSTITISREAAINAILDILKEKSPYHRMTNDELERCMYNLGIGEDVDKPYFGHNFEIE